MENKRESKQIRLTTLKAKGSEKAKIMRALLMDSPIIQKPNILYKCTKLFVDFINSNVVSLYMTGRHSLALNLWYSIKITLFK